MSNTLLVAVAQYDVPHAPEGMAKLDEVAKHAADQRVRLLVVPETAIGSLAQARQASSSFLPELQRIAKQHRVAIATSFYLKDSEQYFNQGHIVSSSGDVVLTHRKIYLARPEQDEDGISAGKDITVSSSGLGKVGMLICKDGFTRYSHYLYETLNELGAQIIAIPSWSLGWHGHNTEEYIKALYTYGAFESRAYVLVAGNLNQDSHSFGRSLIISPIRGVLQEGSRDEEELLIEAIDLNEVEEARRFDSRWQPKTRLF